MILGFVIVLGLTLILFVCVVAFIKKSLQSRGSNSLLGTPARPGILNRIPSQTLSEPLTLQADSFLAGQVFSSNESGTSDSNACDCASSSVAVNDGGVQTTDCGSGNLGGDQTSCDCNGSSGIDFGQSADCCSGSDSTGSDN